MVDEIRATHIFYGAVLDLNSKIESAITFLNINSDTKPNSISLTQEQSVLINELQESYQNLKEQIDTFKQNPVVRERYDLLTLKYTLAMHSVGRY